MEEDVSVYFYFDSLDVASRSVDSLLRSVIRQLVEQSSTAWEWLDELSNLSNCSQMSRRRRLRPSLADLRSIFQNMAETFRTVSIVIDAIDECDNPDELLDLIVTLVSSKVGRLRVFASSRFDGELGERLHTAGKYQVDLRNIAVNADIQAFVQETLKVERRLRQWPKDVRDDIERHLVQGAQGMLVAEIGDKIMSRLTYKM